MKQMLPQRLRALLAVFLGFIVLSCNSDDGDGGVHPVITFGTEMFADGDTLRMSETLVISVRAEKGGAGANIDSLRVLIYVDEYDVGLVAYERGNIDQNEVSWDTIRQPLIFPDWRPITMRIEVTATDLDGNRSIAERSVYVSNEGSDYNPAIIIKEGSVANGAILRDGEPYRLSFVVQKGEDGTNIDIVDVKQYVNGASEPSVLHDTAGIDEESFAYDSGLLTARMIDGAPTKYRLEIFAVEQTFLTAAKTITFTVVE